MHRGFGFQGFGFNRLQRTRAEPYATFDFVLDHMAGIYRQGGTVTRSPLSLSGAADDHDTAVIMRSVSKSAVSKAADTALVEPGSGGLVLPAVAQLISDPLNISGVFSTVTGTGTTVQDAADPFGASNSAWTLTDNDTVSAYHRTRSFTVADDTTSRVASVFIKKVSGTPTHYPALEIGYNTGGTGKTAILILNAERGQYAALNGQNVSGWVEDWGTYWRLCGAMANNATGNTNFFMRLRPAYISTWGVAADGTATGASVFAWPNLHAGSFPVSPVLDDITAGGNVRSYDSGTVGSGVAGFVTFRCADPGSGSVSILALDDGTADNYLAIEHGSSRTLVKLVAGGVEQAAVDIGEWRQGRQTIAFAVGTNYVWGQFVRGLAVSADTTATFPTLTKVGEGGPSSGGTRAAAVIEKVALRYTTVNAASAASIYNEAVNSHGGVIAWDNFDRANGSPGTAPSGQAWGRVNSGSSNHVQAAIASKALVATDSGQATTAAYSALDIGAPASHVRARVSWGEGPTGGVAQLITSRTFDASSNFYITHDGALHMGFTEEAVGVGFFLADSGGPDTISSLRYPTPMLKDGTIYEIGFDITGETITFHIPNSDPITFSDPRIAELNGRYVTWEHYWNTGAAEPSFHLVEAA